LCGGRALHALQCLHEPADVLQRLMRRRSVCRATTFSVALS
jgi:hypothetical protein